MQQFSESLDFFGRTFNFHAGPFRGVSYPATQPQITGKPVYVRTKTDTLNGSADINSDPLAILQSAIIHDRHNSNNVGKLYYYFYLYRVCKKTGPESPKNARALKLLKEGS
jgi:hypothetical protein